MALIGNDAGWTQISREQVPSLGSNVACGLAYTGERDLDGRGGGTPFQGQLNVFSSPGLPAWGGWVSATILTCPSVSDYHKAALGLGAQGQLLSRENEDQVVKVLRDAQQQCQDGHPVVVNILIGRTDFRDGSIAM